MSTEMLVIIKTLIFGVLPVYALIANVSVPSQLYVYLVYLDFDLIQSNQHFIQAVSECTRPSK